MSNTHITLDEADTILETAWNVDGWETSEDNAKQAALDYSAKMIIRRLVVPAEDVPADILKEAIALQAGFLNEHAPTIKRAMRDGIDRAKSMNFGTKSLTRDSGQFRMQQMYCPIVMQTIKDYIPHGAKMVRI